MAFCGGHGCNQWSIIVDWGNFEETFVVWKFNHKWATDDFGEALKELNALVASKPYRTGCIADMRYTYLSDKNLMLIARMLQNQVPSNLGCIVLIVSSDYIPRLYAHFKRIVPNACEISFVQSIDAAYEFIEEHGGAI